ncbi:MAG: UvrD-helicase domain-containing protein [Planctomycetota bacterium]
MSSELSHLLIRASAGSGKTYRLTERYLNLLRAGAEPDGILATTFTRKAAGEITGRVVTTLAEAADKNPADRELLVTLCRQLHRINISTIDSFFFRLANSFRLELDLPDSPTLVADDHPVAVDLRRQAIEAVLTDAGSSEDSFEALLGLLRRLYNDEARRGVTEALRDVIDTHLEVYREAPYARAWTSGEALGLLDGPELTAAINLLLAAEPLLPQHKTWAKTWRADCAAATAGDWDQFAKGGITAAIRDGKDSYCRKVVTPEIIETYGPLVTHAQAIYIDRIFRQTAATYELIQRFVGVYDALRRRQNVLLYSDVGRRLAELPLSEDEALLREVYFRLDASVSHLLLDEFQDTSLDQWRVLFPMADELTSDEAADRSLFVVGDPKQAIYGWRGGCVELFDAAETLRGVTAEPMAKSYRSSQVVLDVVNRVFGNLAQAPSLQDDREAAEAWSERFDQHSAAKDKAGYVRFESTDPAAEGEDDSRAHLRQVAERIKAIHYKAPKATLGVLLRTNRSIRSLLDELRRAGLPASGEAGNPIADHPAVAAVLSALVLADHPGDGPAAFHVVNSPLSETLGMTRVQQADSIARKTRAMLLRDGYAGVIADWVKVLAGACDELGLRRLTQLVELAEAYESSSGNGASPLRASRFVDLVEAAKVEEPGGSLIRVMTIHKSKGLQFDAVVLPELDAELTTKMDVLIDRPDPLGPIGRVWRTPKQEMRRAVPAWDTAYARERARRRSEDFSTLYVAMTRPRHGLYLLAKPASAKGLRGLRFAAILRDTLGDPDESPLVWGEGDWHKQFQHDQISIEAKAADPVLREALGVKLSTGNQSQRMRLRVTPSRLHNNGKVSADDLLMAEPSEAQRRGAEIHKQLEAVQYVDEVSALETLPSSLASIFESEAVRRAFTRRFGDSEVLWRERAFVVADGKHLVRGQFDRVAIKLDESGRPAAAHLIDFKTDVIPSSGEALDRRVEIYRAQIQAYRRALASMLNLAVSQVNSELLFIRSGVSVAI